MRKVVRLISLVWQVPLFVLSFFFYRVMRFGMQKGANREIRKRIKSGDSLKWSGLSEMLKKPMAVTFFMVTGPRWNCHAVIGILGPLKVQSSLDIRIETAYRSAKEWAIIIYRWEGQNKMETYLSSAASRGELWRQISLEPGQYSLGLRYYNCEKRVEFPAIKIDGVERVVSCSMDNEDQDYQFFLNQIQNHHGIFFYCLHYYVFCLLQWRKYFSESFVRREYLPVGNPETSFYYGSLRKGNSLQIDLDKGLLNRANVYLTFYNLCSFPVFWEEIIQTEYHSRPIPGDGHYLIRVQSKNRGVWL